MSARDGYRSFKWKRPVVVIIDYDRSTFSKNNTHCLSWQWPCGSLSGSDKVEGQIIKLEQGSILQWCRVRAISLNFDRITGVSYTGNLKRIGESSIISLPISKAKIS
jgi:hypothetical protein